MRDGGLIELAPIEEAISRPSAYQRQLLARLDQMKARLRDSVFQLAVLGQFKRGKSTLLNAFIGYPLLAAGILPLTAIPTFLTGGTSMRLRITHLSGTVEHHAVDNVEALAREIAAATTEEHNPRNEKGVRRVDVAVPDGPWLDELTLVDTPGIGSTHAHNTEAAHGVLAECDAALFVCSVDPPITEVEIAFLERICRTVPQVIVVLNKVDLVDARDVRTATDFLSSVIGEQALPAVDARVFAVSARLALAARRDGDEKALKASGLLDLEQHVRSKLVDRKRLILELSVAAKMSEISAALGADAAMTVKALSLPLADLDAKTATFERAAADFEHDYTALIDSLNGEWNRATARLTGLCDEIELRVRNDLDEVIAEAASADQPGAGKVLVAAAMTAVFDRELKRAVARVETDLGTTIATQQSRYFALVQRVRETAGVLLDVSMPPLTPESWFEVSREPYWVGEMPLESVSSLTVDGLARLLPAAWQRRRREKLCHEALGKALTRNISELQWTMRQTINDSFRRLLTKSGEAFEMSIASTRDLLTSTLDRRMAEDFSLQLELARACRTEQRLSRLSSALARRVSDNSSKQ